MPLPQFLKAGKQKETRWELGKMGSKGQDKALCPGRHREESSWAGLGRTSLLFLVSGNSAAPRPEESGLCHPSGGQPGSGSRHLVLRAGSLWALLSLADSALEIGEGN